MIYHFFSGNACLNIIILCNLLMRQDVWFKNQLVIESHRCHLHCIIIESHRCHWCLLNPTVATNHYWVPPLPPIIIESHRYHQSLSNPTAAINHYWILPLPPIISLLPPTIIESHHCHQSLLIPLLSPIIIESYCCHQWLLNPTAATYDYWIPPLPVCHWPLSNPTTATNYYWIPPLPLIINKSQHCHLSLLNPTTATDILFNPTTAIVVALKFWALVMWFIKATKLFWLHKKCIFVHFLSFMYIYSTSWGPNCLKNDSKTCIF